MNPNEQQVDMSWKNYPSKDANSGSPPAAGGTKRSRITRACDICRRKKIKCDIDDSQQCTTCKQYGWECTFNDTTKKRGPPKGYIESLETRLRKMEQLLEKMQPEDDNNKSLSQLIVDTESNNTGQHKKIKREREISPSMEIPNSVEHSKVVRYLGSSSGYYLVRDILSNEGEEIEEIKNAPLFNTDGKRRESVLEPEVGPLRFRKINVVDDDIMFVRNKTLAEHVDQLETDKLDLNLNIAPKSVLDELIARFFDMDHSTLPIVDKDDFLNAYEGRTKPPPATILIYAICTHACILLPADDPVFINAKLEREELFDTLVEHTTTLVRKEYLTPRLATIQALILLCAYPACDKSFYRNWLRVGMAVRMAQELGLHRTLEKLPLTEEMFEARKRLFFATYITDRWCCAVMGRPLAIADADCDIELPHVNGGVNGTKDYSLFINFVKLSGILGEVLRRIYSPKAKSLGYKDISAYHTVQSIYRTLNDWLEQVPDHQRITSDEAKTIYKNKIMTNKVREAGPLMTCYHVVIILLYRVFLVSDKADVLPELYEEAAKRCTEAAKSTIDIARLLSPSEVVRFGWNFAGYSMFQATLIHIYNCTSSNPEVAKTALEYSKICMEECIEPMSKENSSVPRHTLPLIKTLMDLSGAAAAKSLGESASTNTPPKPSSNTYNSSFEASAKAAPTANNIYNPYPPQQQQSFNNNLQQQPSPMSVHAIVSNDWDKNVNQQQQQQPQQQLHQQQDTFVSNNISAAAWQSLFSSAATPFFDNESDWQTTLSSLFDDAQLKQTNLFLP